MTLRPAGAIGGMGMVAKLVQTGRRRTATLFVADDRLVEECRVGKEQWRRSWALRDLSPDFGLVSGSA